MTEKTIGSRMLYQAEKHNAQLAELPLPEHVAVFNLLKTLLEARVNEYQQEQLKAQQSQKEAGVGGAKLWTPGEHPSQ